MKIETAIIEIEKMGFRANLWEKAGKQRIYIDFNFKGSKRSGGFIGRDKTELVAQACGRHTEKYQAKLDQIAKFNIEWNQPEDDVASSILEARSSMSRAAYMAKKERRDDLESWRFSHDL